MAQPTDLYRFYDDDGTLLYVGVSLSAAHRAAEHRREKEWWCDVANMTVTHYASRAEAEAAELEAIASESPLHNIVGTPKRPKAARTPLDWLWSRVELVNRETANAYVTHRDVRLCDECAEGEPGNHLLYNATTGLHRIVYLIRKPESRGRYSNGRKLENWDASHEDFLSHFTLEAVLSELLNALDDITGMVSEMREAEETPDA